MKAPRRFTQRRGRAEKRHSGEQAGQTRGRAGEEEDRAKEDQECVRQSFAQRTIPRPNRVPVLRIRNTNASESGKASPKTPLLIGGRASPIPSRYSNQTTTDMKPTCRLHSQPMILLLLVATLVSACRTDPQREAEALLAKAQRIQKDDPQTALRYTTLSAQMGHIPAMIALGNHTADGKLQPWLKVRFAADTNSANLQNEWYKQARAAFLADTSATSLAMAAMMFRNGYGGDPDSEKAFDLLIEAASRGHQNGLLIGLMWALKDNNRQAEERIIRTAKDHALDVYYLLQSNANGFHDPADVVGLAGPLADGAAVGSESAAKALATLTSQLRVLADKNNQEAIESINRLKAADLWREPSRNL